MKKFKNIMRHEWILPPETIPERNNDVLIGRAMNFTFPGDTIQVDIGEGSYGYQYGDKLIDGISRHIAKHEIKRGDWVWLSDIQCEEIPKTGRQLIP